MGTQPSNLKNSAIDDYAQVIGDVYEIYDAEGKADLDILLHKLGGKVDFALDSESLHVRETRDFTIFIPAFTSSRRDRFTTAHELGHYVLHYLYPEHSSPMSFARGGRDRAETEANIFASALLMPSEAFKQAFTRYDGEEWKLAVHFDVSPAAADVRAQVLGLK